MTREANLRDMSSYQAPNGTHNYGVRIPEELMEVAAKALGLPPDVASGTLIRAALAKVADVAPPVMSRGRRGPLNYIPEVPLEGEVAA